MSPNKRTQHHLGNLVKKLKLNLIQPLDLTTNLQGNIGAHIKEHAVVLAKSLLWGALLNCSISSTNKYQGII